MQSIPSAVPCLNSTAVHSSSQCAVPHWLHGVGWEECGHPGRLCESKSPYRRRNYVKLSCAARGQTSDFRSRRKAISVYFRSNFYYLPVCFWNCLGRFSVKILPSKCSHYSSVIEPAEDDLIMGERAAARANSTLNKCLVSMLSISSSLKLPAPATPRISGMYVGKNVGVSRAVGNSLEKSIWKEGC